MKLSSVLQTLLIALICVAIGGGGVYWIYSQKISMVEIQLATEQAKSQSLEKQIMDHKHEEEAMKHAMHMEHEQLDITETDWEPTVALEVTADPKAGWNLQVTTEDFDFAPTNASTEHVEGEGHAHVYVDDMKVGRLYGEWYHVDKLEPGEHEIRVTLNSNDHSDLVRDNEAIQATATVTQE